MTTIQTNARVAGLRVEYLTNPVGIDAVRPRLCWRMESPARCQKQTAYRIVAAREESALDGTDLLWDSGKVESGETTHIPYGGPELGHRKRVFWRVKSWDIDAIETPWSETAFFEIGLLSVDDWYANWIGTGSGRKIDPVDGASPAVYLRRTATLTQAVRRARFYATARGVYRLHINGSRVGDEELAPGFVDYNKRIPYQTYDITSLVREGNNSFGAIVAEGWYAGRIGWERKGDNYGDRLEFLGQIEIEYVDGSRLVIGTDCAWSWTESGPLTNVGLLAGEVYDARLRMPGWDSADYVQRSEQWNPAIVYGAVESTPKLVAKCDPPIRVTQEIRPIAITEPDPGVYIYDLGQNMVGWIRLTATGKSGSTITVRYAEILENERLYITNLRGAEVTDRFTFATDGDDVFEPQFTFHGFRYVELTGCSEPPNLESVTGRVVHSDTPLIGSFECSHPKVNQLFNNILWGQRGNFLSVPTDCPQRDERLGWMGDAEVFLPSAAYNADVASFFVKWLDDVADAQSPEGGFSDVAPRIVDTSDSASAWADAGVICPWTLFSVYGDKHELAKRYPSMKAWVDCTNRYNANHLWLNNRGNDFGDWLSQGAETSKDVLATAYFANSTSLVAQAAAALGYEADAHKYEQLFASICAAFEAAYVEADGMIESDTQTCYALALRFAIMPSRSPEFANRLAEDIRGRGNRLSTGFVGVSHLLPALSDHGYLDVAYDLLLQEEFPSWLYSVNHGATTIWERWDGWTEHAGFQDPGMNSFNHYALGSAGEWLYRTVAGIAADPAHPGFSHFLLAPKPGGMVTHAKATYGSIQGEISSAWQADGAKFRWQVTVPANTSATVTLPTSQPNQATEGRIPLDAVDGITDVRREAGAVVFELAAGMYEFEAVV